jgi:hypothetical protein
MKLLLYTLSLLYLTTTMTVVHGAGESVGTMHTCEEQAPCLQVRVIEVTGKCDSGSCEYEVCWTQLVGESGCFKNGDVQYLGDMHRYGDTEDTDEGGCLNEENENGKGYWDSNCTDPENVYSTGTDYTSFFKGICQVVAPGHTVHLLINDGDSCAEGETATVDDATGLGLTAYCAPSTQDNDSSNVGGQTYFPASDGTDGGTCSIEDEGYECIWSITVPDTCVGSEYVCSDVDAANPNDEDLCDEGSVLRYYENTQNGEPPIIPIHDITFNEENATVTFRVLNPFEDDLHDMYTIYHQPGDYDDNWDEKCHKEQAADSCPSDDQITAKCMHDDMFTIVTVFASGYSDESGAAVLVADGGEEGTDIYNCCTTDAEPKNHVREEYIAAWTYMIHCACESIDDTPQRALRVQSDLVERFQKGELFNDELKELYGLH